jgi:hypothetical protein
MAQKLKYKFKCPWCENGTELGVQDVVTTTGRLHSIYREDDGGIIHAAIPMDENTDRVFFCYNCNETFDWQELLDMNYITIQD